MYRSTKHGGIWIEATLGDKLESFLADARTVVGWGLALGAAGSVVMALFCTAVSR